MSAQPYTAADLLLGEQIVRELHGLKGFEAWAERIAKAVAAARSPSPEGREEGGGEMSTSFLPCPVCGRKPDSGLCEPWEARYGSQPYFAICYAQDPFEHCIGVNGDSQRQVLDNWNKAAVPLPTPAPAGEWQTKLGIVLTALRDFEEAVGETYNDEGGDIAAIEAELNAASASPDIRPAGEWQDISSAPRDGTAVWLAVNGRPYIGYCEPADGWLRKRDLWFAKATYRRKSEPEPYETLTTDKVYLTRGADVQPTHWQPLPASPSPGIKP